MQSILVSPLARTRQLVLSVPVQIFLFLALGSLSLWLLYFSAHPSTHNAMHHGRHTTLGVACH
ncbi:MAG: CbtB domain-containing protein [Prochlorotrichaceae cyanobacterium]|jgi:low temperature requirement protein LtrA